MRTKKGDPIVLLKAIRNREAEYKDKTGSTKLSLVKGNRLVAATNESGGDIYADATTPDGAEVIVILRDGEWEPG